MTSRRDFIKQLVGEYAGEGKKVSYKEAYNQISDGEWEDIKSQEEGYDKRGRLRRRNR